MVEPGKKPGAAQGPGDAVPGRPNGTGENRRPPGKHLEPRMVRAAASPTPCTSISSAEMVRPAHRLRRPCCRIQQDAHPCGSRPVPNSISADFGGMSRRPCRPACVPQDRELRTTGSDSYSGSSVIASKQLRAGFVIRSIFGDKARLGARRSGRPARRGQMSTPSGARLVPGNADLKVHGRLHSSLVRLGWVTTA